MKRHRLPDFSAFTNQLKIDSDLAVIKRAYRPEVLGWRAPDGAKSAEGGATVKGTHNGVRRFNFVR